MTSVFAKYRDSLYPYKFDGELVVSNIFGGIPSDPKVIESWLTTKLAPKGDIIRELVAETMTERDISVGEAVDEIATKHLVGFKRDPERGGELYVEGRALKAAIKEAASVAMGAGKLNVRGWGKTNKGLLSYLAEHVFVIDDRLHLGVKEPSGINTDFVHTFRGSSIQYSEFVDTAHIHFTVLSDHHFSDEEWAAIWSAGELNGLGASRSQGRGRYEVTKWGARDGAREGVEVNVESLVGTDSLVFS